jgi:hypothetical protein
MTRLIRFVVCATALFLGASCVSADPVQITSGSLLVNGSLGLAPISVFGTHGFSVTGDALPSEGRIDPFTDCNPCVPGASVSLGGSLSEAAFSGTATFEGSAFPLELRLNAPNSLLFEWSGTTIAPPESNGPVTVAGPFAVTGTLFRSFGTDKVDFSGGGTASLSLNPLHLGADFGWQVNRVRYDFESAAATPEPATLTLLSIGVLAGAARSRRQRWTLKAGSEH